MKVDEETSVYGCHFCWERRGCIGPPPQRSAPHGKDCAKGMWDAIDSAAGKAPIIRRSSSTGRVGPKRRGTIGTPGELPRLSNAAGVHQRRASKDSPGIQLQDSTKALPWIRGTSSPSHAVGDNEDVAAQEELRERIASVKNKLTQNKHVSRAMLTLTKHIIESDMSLEEMYAALDENGDGELSKTEMQVALRKLGVMLLPAELDAVLRSFDTDGNGTIDFNEFRELITQWAPLVPKPEVQDEQDRVICGFECGTRVRILARLAGNKGQREEGTVVGRGVSEGMVLVQQDRQNISVKPNMLVLLGRQRSKGTSERCGSKGTSERCGSKHAPERPT